MIEGKALQKTCHSTLVADKLDFKLVNGSVYGVLDPLGTTVGAFLALLAGAITPDSGFVRINGFDTVKDRAKAGKCIGYMPKNLIPYPDMTPEEYLSFIAEARGLDFEDGVRVVSSLLNQAELRGRKRSLCTHLSPSERKRLCLAQALVGDPEILILEEPCVGIGEREKLALLDRIDLLADTKTVIIGSTSLSLLRDVCDSILVLSEGRLLGTYDANDEALDTLFANLCKNSGMESLPDTAPSRLSKKRHSKRTYTPPKKRGEYELIDDDGNEA
ncbi:MAG: ABC transporter ATP-binding protein [Clostridia bacterium]|nr:ABC transporter ATP-binding protein [Clostridia bacterium]